MERMQGNGIIGAITAGFMALAVVIVLLPASADAQTVNTPGGTVVTPPKPPVPQPDFNRLTGYPNYLGAYNPDDEFPGSGDKEPRTRDKHPKPLGHTDLTHLEAVPTLGALMAPNGIPAVTPEPKKLSVLHKLENRLPLMAVTGLAETPAADGRSAALAALDNAHPIF